MCEAVFFTPSRNRKYCAEHSACIRTTGIGREDSATDGYVPPPEEGKEKQ